MKTQTTYILLLLGLWATFGSGARAQDKATGDRPGTGTVLTLDMAVSQALQHNASLLAQQHRVARSTAVLDETKAFFLPQFNVSHTGVYTNAPLHAFGFKLQQRDVTAADFDPSRLTAPGDVSNYVTQAELKVPVFHPEGLYQRKAAQQGVIAARQQQLFAEKTVAFHVQQVYFGLYLLDEHAQVLDKAAQATQSALRYLTDNQEAGYVRRSDVLALEVRWSELKSQQLQVAENRRHYAGQLHQLMGDTLQTVYMLSDPLPEVPPGLPAPASSLDRRPDFQAWQAGVQARQQAIAAQRAQLLPTLSAFGQYQYHDRNLFGTRSGFYMAGFHLQWNLFQGMQRSSRTAQAKAEQAITQAEFAAYRQQAEEDYAQAWRALELARQEVSTAGVAVGQASEAFRIRQDRHQQGLERTPDLLAAEVTLAQQQLRLIQARYQLYVAQARYQYLHPENYNR